MPRCSAPSPSGALSFAVAGPALSPAACADVGVGVVVGMVLRAVGDGSTESRSADATLAPVLGEVGQRQMLDVHAGAMPALGPTGAGEVAVVALVVDALLATRQQVAAEVVGHDDAMHVAVVDATVAALIPSHGGDEAVPVRDGRGKDSIEEVHMPSLVGGVR
jgi:hypothetical protein